MDNFFFLKSDKPMWPASANTFIIQDDSGLIVIDVGCGLKKFVKKFYKKVEDLKLNIKDVHTIVVSHAHPDHMGALDEIFQQVLDYHNTNIIINEIEKESALNIALLNNTFDVDLVQKYYSPNNGNRPMEIDDINQNFKILCSMSQLPKDCNIQIIKHNDILRLGQFEFKVLTTPGHAPGHTAFYEIHHKFLLSGDLIGEKGTAWYSPSSGGATGYLSSLDLIESLPIEKIFPSHGNIFMNVKERMNQIRQKILIKDQIILDQVTKKPQKISDLVQLFYTESYSQVFPGLAIIESHLIKLENEGKIERKNNLIYRINNKK